MSAPNKTQQVQSEVDEVVGIMQGNIITYERKYPQSYAARRTN